MSVKSIRSRVQLNIFADQIAILSSWGVSYWFRFYTGVPLPKGFAPWLPYAKLLPFIISIWIATFFVFRLYERTRIFASPLLENLQIFKACLAAFFIFTAVTYFYREFEYSRATIAMFIAIHPFAVCFGRSLVRKFFRKLHLWGEPRRLVIIGDASTLKNIQTMIPSLYLEKPKIVCTVLMDKVIDQGEKLSFFGEIQNWPEFLSKVRAESLVVSVSRSNEERLFNMMPVISEQVTDLILFPNLEPFVRFGSTPMLLEGNPIWSIHESPLHGFGAFAKRCMDICGSVVALVMFSPIMIFCAAMVRAESPGPIFYSQERMGVDGKVFRILKFRSMPIQAESKTGAVWATAEDNRATKFGSFMRKTSLDELPQFINVLLGQMSLVGPRPERPVFVDQFRQHVPGYMLRHKVKAGITGWAQINGWRGNTSIEKRIQFDLYYIQNWSMWLDVKILVMTVFKGFTDPNAY